MAEKKVDEATLRRALVGTVAEWERIRAKYGPQLLVGVTGTKLFEALHDLRRRLVRMIDQIAGDAARANRGHFTYTPHLGRIYPPEKTKGDFVSIHPGQAEQLKAALNQAASTFAHYRTQINTLFVNAGGTSTAALTHASQLCGYWVHELRLRLEYVAAMDKIKCFGDAGPRTLPVWRTPAELQATVANAKAQAAAAEAARKKQQEEQEDDDDDGWLDKAKDKATHAASSYAKGIWVDAAPGMVKSYWEYSPFRIATNPKDWWNGTVKNNWKAVHYAWEDPAGFGRNYATRAWDIETWKKDPARALGHLAADGVAALAMHRIVKTPEVPKLPGKEVPEFTAPNIGRVDKNGVRHFDSDRDGERYGEAVYGNAAKRLSPSTFRALREYTNASNPYNPILRTSNPSKQRAILDRMKATPSTRAMLTASFGGKFPTLKDIKERIRIIDGSMASLPEGVQLHRALRDLDFMKGFSGDPRSIIGKTQKEPGLMSASLGKNSGFPDRTYQLHLAAPKGTRGTWIGPRSMFAQRELLLARDTKYKIIDVKPRGDGKWDIYAEIVP